MVYKTSIMNETPRQHSFKTCTRVFNMTCLSNPRDCVQALEVSVDFQINSERSPWAEDIYNSLKLFQIMHVSFRQHMCTLWPQTMEPLRFQTLGGGWGYPRIEIGPPGFTRDNLHFASVWITPWHFWSGMLNKLLWEQRNVTMTQLERDDYTYEFFRIHPEGWLVDD